MSKIAIIKIIVNSIIILRNAETIFKCLFQFLKPTLHLKFHFVKRIMKQRHIVLGTLILAIFTFVVAVSSLYVQVQLESGNLCGCVIPLSLFLPFLASLGLFIGTLIYYLFSPRLESRRVDLDVFLNLLERDEAKVIRALLSCGGEATQAKLSKLTGYDRVKIFRIVSKLKRRGAIEKLPKGKTNLIRLKLDTKAVP